MKHEGFVNSWMQSKIQKAKNEKQQSELQNKKNQFFEEQVTSIRESIYQPLMNLVAEMNDALSKQENETLKKQKVQITPLGFQENRYISFDIIDGESHLDFQFEVISLENYNVDTCKRLGLELDYINARDCDVYPQYRTNKIIWWGIVSGNAGIGFNILYCESKDTDQGKLKIIKKEVENDNGKPQNFQTFDELYKRAMYGWYHTTSEDYTIEAIKMLMRMNDFWQKA